MMQAAAWQDRLRRACLMEGRPSSDYDLNSGFSLPKDRVLRPASVLIGVQMRAERPMVYLTKRSPALKNHPGQIAFPGGKVDPGDADSVAAGIREAKEEIGLPPDNIEILGQLAAHETVTSFRITPVLAWIHGDFRPVAEAGEVAEVFTAPLDHVLDPARYRIEGRQWRGTKRFYYAVPYGPYYIWGATARMLRALADQVVP